MATAVYINGKLVSDMALIFRTSLRCHPMLHRKSKVCQDLDDPGLDSRPALITRRLALCLRLLQTG